MYVEFMKNFLLADSCELLAVRLISFSWAQENLIRTFFLDIMYVDFMKNFLLADLLDMYVEFMKNFLLVDSSELLAVRLISASWAQENLIRTFLTWCTSTSWKIFFSTWWLLHSFRPPEPIRASWWLLHSFRPPDRKNVWFLLSRHDVRQALEKNSSRRFERAILLD